MKIIDEIIEELTDKSNRLTDILIKTKLLAYKLKNDELKEWVNSELNGYTKDTLPLYRILPCLIIGSLSNGFERVNNYPIPLNKLNEKFRDVLTTIYLLQSISTLDDFINNKNEDQLVNPISPEYYGYLSKCMDNSSFIEYAERSIDRLQIVQVMTTVKAKLLDFLLKLNDEFGGIEDIKSFTEGKAKDKVSSIFNSSIFGDNTTIIVGDNNTQTITNITKGNFETLARLLNEQGVAKSDIDELQSIIDIDYPQENQRVFGTKVKGWISKMLSKAMDNSWKIGLGAAGKLLADAIEMYYGWK